MAQVASDVKIYRKRLNRWKNIGVWFVFTTVGLIELSVACIKYEGTHHDVRDKSDPRLHKWIVLGLTAGAFNLITQVIACCIMASATLTMKKLTDKNGFDPSQFKDI